MNIALSRLNALLAYVKARFFAVAIVGSFVALASLLIFQSLRHGILNTELLLGWDSSGYVWSARNVIYNGPLFMIQYWKFPQLYILLLAFFGYVISNVVLVERILPLIFAFVLVYSSSRCILEITGSSYFAGLNAFLNVISINTLRLLSDLNRNLMAMSLSFVALLMFSHSEQEKTILSKRQLLTLAILLIIAGTHFETYALLSVVLVLQGMLGGNYKKAVARLVLCTIPGLVLTPMLFYSGFFSSWGTELAIGSPLRFDEVIQWSGGSIFLCLFLVPGMIYLVYRSIKNRNALAQLILLWVLIVVALAFVIESGILGLSHEVSFRLLLTLPISALLSLSALAAMRSTENVKFRFRIFSAKKSYPVSISAHHIAAIVTILVLASAPLVAYQQAGNYLTPYIQNSVLLKINETHKFLDENQLTVPVVILYGEPAIWHGWLFRTYIGAELGEHFAYYGEFDKLLASGPSSIDYENQIERNLSKAWYDEMKGQLRTVWPHSTQITDIEDLKSRPLLIISPDLYVGKLPYYLKPFHIGDGIYVVPPNTISDTNRTLYGPSVTLLRDGVPLETRSEYLDIDPNDPSISYIMVKAPSGSGNYAVTNFPANWIFDRISQGGDVSFPEEYPVRPNGNPAAIGNDPAEVLDGWSPIAVNVEVLLDTQFRKEGISSLRISGTHDSWGNLGLLYDLPGTWDLSEFNSLAVWARSSEPAPFSVTLIDLNGNTRTYWSISAPDGISASTEWKRFVIRLDNFTSEVGQFTMNAVDRIFSYTWYSGSNGKVTTLWIDDLTLDKIADFRTYVHKDRVLLDDFVVFYFKEKESSD